MSIYQTKNRNNQYSKIRQKLIRNQKKLVTKLAINQSSHIKLVILRFVKNRQKSQELDVTSQLQWNLLTRIPQWSEIPVACTCCICFANYVCQCTSLLASLFNPDVREFRKNIQLRLCRSASSAGQYLIEEAKCDENTTSSKVTYMTGSKDSKLSKSPQAPSKALAPQREAVLPEPVCPSQSGADFQVALCSGASDISD